MPVGAFGGRREIMEKIARSGPVYQAGTLSGNPVAVAAGLATLKLIRQPGFYESLTKKTLRLTDGLCRRGEEAWRRFRARSRSAACSASTSPKRLPGDLRGSAGMRQGGLQPLLPRHARCRPLLRAVGLRGRFCLGGAFATPISTRRSRRPTHTSLRHEPVRCLAGAVRRRSVRDRLGGRTEIYRGVFAAVAVGRHGRGDGCPRCCCWAWR